MDSVGHFDTPKRGETRPVESLLQGYAYIEPSDVAYAKVTPCFENGKGIIGTDLIEPSFGSSELTVLRPNSMMDQRYLSYVLRSEPFRAPAIASMTGAGGLKRVDEQEMRALKVWTPPIREQRAIADHLDHETAEIDALISDFQEFRRLLRQSRTSRQNEIFSPYLRSGTSDLRGLIDERDDRIGIGAHPEDLLSVSIANGVSRWVEKTDDLPMSDSLEKYKRVEPNDLVLNRMRAFQGGIGVSAWRGITSPDYAVLRPSPHLLPEFAELLIKSDRFVFEIKRRLRGIGNEASGQVRTPRISVADLVRIPVTLPRLATQKQVISDWKHFSNKVGAEDSDALEAIKLAQERRVALISAAVNGQIDLTHRDKPVARQIEEEVLQNA